MREKLNNNPKAQIAVIVVLLAAAAFMLLGKSGGGESGSGEAAAPTEATAAATAASGGEAVEGAIPAATTTEMPTSVPAPSPPAAFTAAYDSGKTVVLLVVHDGGVDDAFTTAATLPLAKARNVALFVVPTRRVARYAAVTVGLDLNRVPALVVMRPKRLSGGVPQATVDYGFQTPQSVIQAVLDASYKGPEVTTYHPN